MTPEQLIIRVESALHQAGRDETPLASQWRECCRRWGPESGAARGVLLELVREAWGGAGIEVSIYDDGAWLRIESSPGVCAFEVDANGLGQALIEALEAGQ